MGQRSTKHFCGQIFFFDAIPLDIAKKTVLLGESGEKNWYEFAILAIRRYAKIEV